MYYLKQLLIIGILLFSFRVVAQNQCQEDIDEANKLFDEGEFRNAEKLAKRTLETCELNKIQEDEMLKLLASIYYEIDEIELGDEYVSEFMKKNPYYVVSKRNDPIQLRDAIRKLKSLPRFSVGITMGETFGSITTIKVFQLLDSADYLQPYTVKPIFQGGMELNWNMSSFISLKVGAGIRIQNIMQQVPYYNQLYFNYQEKTVSANFPLALAFTIPISSLFESQVYLGGEMELFTLGRYSYFYTGDSNISNDLSFFLNRKKNNVKIEPDFRNQYRIAAIGGIRFMYKIKRFSIFTDFKYTREFDLYNNPDKRFSDFDLFFSNNYSLADIQIENYDISLGLIFNFSYRIKSKY